MCEMHCLLHRDWEQFLGYLALLRKLFLWFVTSAAIYYFHMKSYGSCSVCLFLIE